MSDIVYCKDCAYAEPNNLTAYETVKLGVFCTRYKQNIAGIYGCDNGKPKAKTNADRIRNMTDEELAKFFDSEACLFPWCCDMSCPEDGSCRPCVLKWLKQDVDE